MVEASPQRANMGYIGAIVAVATIGGFLFGYDSGAVNGTQEGLRETFGLSDAGLGFTVGSLLIGCFIGAFFAGRLADLIGRRNTMMIAALLFLVGALIQGSAHDHMIFVIARLAGGMAVGAASVLSPAYISEVAPASIRGRLTTLQQIMIIIGLTIAFVVNYFLALSAGESTAPYWAGIEAWRWMYLMQAVPAAIFLFALIFIPESPRYLVSKGREEKAESVLASLFGSGVAGEKLREIRATFAEDHRPRLSDLKAPGGGIRKVVWAGIMLAPNSTRNVGADYRLRKARLNTDAQELLPTIEQGRVSRPCADGGNGVGIGLEIARRVGSGARALAQHVERIAKLAVRACARQRLLDGLSQYKMGAEQSHRLARGESHRRHAEPLHQALDNAVRGFTRMDDAGRYPEGPGRS